MIPKYATPLSVEELQSRTSNSSKKARVDIRTRGFWERGQQAFFDLKVFNPKAGCYSNKSLHQCHVMNEQEKKRAYNERILKVDHGTFTPLVFSIIGGVRREYQKFYSRLEQLISKKRDLLGSILSNWIRINVCFGLLKSSLLCLRGSRTICRKTTEFVKLMLMPKYKVDDNHKTNFDTFDFFCFFRICKLRSAAAYNLQRISKM